MSRRVVTTVAASFLTAWVAAIPLFGDEARSQADRQQPPIWVQAEMTPKSYPVLLTKRPHAGMSAQEWAQLIDDTWGEGQTTAVKLSVFDHFWIKIDLDFPCFQDIDVNWDGLRDTYRQEVAEGVSKGRFAAIMSRLALALMEAHTQARDKDVWGTAPVPGVPLLLVGGWATESEFGACLTPLPDRSLLVYRADADHPLNLAPGDVVLGYDGRPWHELYPELLEYGLPVSGFWGSCEESFEHAWLMAAGANWHLFETIDVQRHGADEVEHLSTAVLDGWQSPVWCSEQLDVPGVSMPVYDDEQLFTWGIIDGTRIGYIYGWGWFWEAEQEFYDAVFRLMTEHVTEGLVIDFRFNMGGNMFLSDRALALLFDREVETIDWVVRCDPNDHLGLCEEHAGDHYAIPGDPATFYDHPIAVLVGPGAVSSGDQVALRMKFHPRARFFGKTTNTAFNSPNTMRDDDVWSLRYAEADAYLMSNPGEYLTHDPFPVDEDVWLEPGDVAEGRDTVVEAALEWIQMANSRTPRRPSRRVGSENP